MVALWFLLADEPWSPDVRADDASGSNSQNETALGGYGDLYTGSWNDYREGSWHDYYSYSSNGGSSWSSDTGFDAVWYDYTCDPVVLVDRDGVVHYILMDFNYSYDGTLWHMKSTDYGQTWSSPVNISGNSSGLTDKPWATLPPSKNGDTIYVCWVLFYGSQDGTYFARSTDGGQTWTRQRISSTSYGSMPYICTDWGGNVYVIWRDYGSEQYRLRCSRDAGETWDTEAFVDYFDWTSDGTRAPAVPAIAGGPPGHVYAVYMSEKYSSAYQWDILFTKSTDYGQTWSTPIAINTVTGRPHKAKLPTITVDPSGDIWVIWAQYNAAGDGKWSVEWAVSFDEGQTWTYLADSGYTGRVSDVSFSDAGGGSGGGMYMGDYMTAISDSDYVAVLWADDRDGDYKVYFSKLDLRQFLATREDAGSKVEWARWAGGRLLLNLPEPSDVRVRVYSVDGRLVQDFSKELASGRHALELEGLRGVGFALVETQRGAYRVKIAR